MRQIKNPFILILIVFSINSFTQDSKTIIKGKLIDWPTDTVYLQTLPFHSPCLSKLYSQEVGKDGQFRFELEAQKTPVVVQIQHSFSSVKMCKEELLEANYGDKYYYGHCIKFYKYGGATVLIEPNKTLVLEITADAEEIQLSKQKADFYRSKGGNIPANNKVIKDDETELEFLVENPNQYELFQDLIGVEERVDKRLSIYRNKPMEDAVKVSEKIMNEELEDLDEEKENISEVHYNYLRAQIIYGAKLEFMKHLMLPERNESNDRVNKLYTEKVPKVIMDFIDHDQKSIGKYEMLSENYNKYLQLFLNFIVNTYNKEYKKYNKFSKVKCQLAMRNFPKQLAYHYIATCVCKEKREEDFIEEMIVSTIRHYPDGEFNELLFEKYDL
jgi:hypothetical protein